MTIRSKKFKRKSIRRNKKSIRRNKKSRINKRLKKYGGTQTDIYVSFFGEKLYQPNVEYGVDTTIDDLVKSKNGYLYHNGKLLSTYPRNKRAFDVLPKNKDPKKIGRYDLQLVKRPTVNLSDPSMPPEPPPETIPIVELKPYEYDDDKDPNNT